MRHLVCLFVMFICCSPRSLAGLAVLEFSVPGVSAQQPQMGVAPDGTLYLVYGAGDTIYCAASRDHGKQFSKPAAIKAPGILSLGRHRGPRVAATQTGVVVTAIVGKQGQGKDGDLLAWHSVNRGKTWSQPVVVNDAPGSAREGLHGMAAGPRGIVFSAWLDLRSASDGDQRTKLYGTVSNDGGKTWSRNRLVYRSPDGTICECCHPSVTIDTQGTFHVMWRKALGGSRDLYHIASRDGGKSFEAAKKFGQGTWPLNSCPMDGGELAVDSNGKVSAAWRREDKVYVSGLNDAETLVGTGRNPVIAQGTRGRYVAWEDTAAKAGVLLPPGASRPRPLGHKSQYIDLIATGGKIVAAWEEARGEQQVVKLQVLE